MHGIIKVLEICHYFLVNLRNAIEILRQVVGSMICKIWIVYTHLNYWTDFGCEHYLQDIKTSSFKQILVKFRGGLLDLRANSGKFEKILQTMQYSSRKK